MLAVAAVVCLLAAACKDNGSPIVEPPPDTAVAPGSTTLAPTTTGPGSTTTAAPSPAIAWKACGSNECGTLKVPLDHAQPTGKTIDIAVSRRKAKNQAARIGSLVFNPGGPGASGIELLDYTVGRLPTDIAQRFDIVGFDPRGVGQSTPIDCLPDAGLDAFFHADPVPDDAKERQELIDVTKAFVAGCQKNSGELLPHIGTADAARDMDLLRAALGDQKLTYVGFSYGTELGAAYLNLFPDHVRALVLDGAVDPTISTNESNKVQAQGFDSALDAFIRDCQAKGATCAWKPAGGASKDAFIKLMDAIDAKAIAGSGKRTVGPSEAILGAAAALYDERTWSSLAAALEQAAAGRGSILLQLFDSIVDRKPNGTYTSLQEVYSAVTCRDRAHPSGVEDVEATAHAAAQESPAFGATIAWSGLVCALWPIPAETFPAAAGARPPVLVIGTTNDPATPFVWAKALSQQLGARLLTYKGEGHTAFGKDTCVDRIGNAYLLDLTLPAEGKTC
jgi:pimeloyl-ACP methyl ester carboxylesterase